MNEHLSGLRPEDLHEAAQAAREALLRTDPAAAQDAAFAEALAARMQAEPLPVGNPGEIRRRLRQRGPQRRGWAVAGALLAAGLVGAVLWAAQPPERTFRERGAAGGSAVHLEGAALGPAGLRPLPPGAVVAPDERVLFQMSVGAAGQLTLFEHHDGQRRTVVPSEPYPRGTHVPGGASATTYRPDGGPGTYAYELELCTAPGVCQSDHLELMWSD